MHQIKKDSILISKQNHIRCVNKSIHWACEGRRRVKVRGERGISVPDARKRRKEKKQHQQ